MWTQIDSASDSKRACIYEKTTKLAMKYGGEGEIPLESPRQGIENTGDIQLSPHLMRVSGLSAFEIF
jgi:hypothetical protein